MKSLWTAQGLSKNILLKAELQCILSVRKNLRNNKKKQARWSSELKIWEVKEFIRIEKASFKKQKLYPNEENIKDHKLWQIKCKNIIRQAKKKEFEEQLAGAIKSNTKFLFHHIRAKSLPGSLWSPLTARLSPQRGQGCCRKGEWMLASLLTVEETEDISSLEAFLEGNAAEDPSET